MSRLKLDSDALGLSSVVERVTHVKVKDCFKDDEGETLYFIVGVGEVGKAIGKGGVNIRQLQMEFNKRVRIIEHSEDVVLFVRNVIYPLVVEEIVEQGSELIIKDSNKKTKSLLIGRDSKNLRVISRAVKRFFPLDVRVM